MINQGVAVQLFLATESAESVATHLQRVSPLSGLVCTNIQPVSLRLPV